jgi:putative ABC transport system ATP-binding protein
VEATVAAVAAAAQVFTARGLTKVYDVGEVRVEALRGVDFDLWPGEFVVLLGPSGSGKSTLLNILGGLDVPTSGEVIYDGQNLTKADEAALTAYRRTHVGFVFQFYNLIPSLTARENVALVTELVEHPMSPRHALELVGLGDRLDHFPSQLSGGEQQRVAIARAISRPAHSTSRPASSSSRRSSGSTANWARRPSSSRTTRRSRAWPTASSVWPTGA